MRTATEQQVETKLRVIVHVHATLARVSIANLLDSTDGIVARGDAGTVDDLRRIVSGEEPDVVVVDAGASAVEMAEAISAVKQASPRTGVLVLADDATGSFVEGALRAGADGFLLWDVTPEQLIDAIGTVGRGGAVLHPKAAAMAGRRLRGESTSRLTPRQTEIVRLLTEGLPNKQIARKLGIAVETVKTHLERIFERLEVASRTEAVAVAMREGVV